MYGGCREIEDVPAQGLDDMYRGDGIVAKANLMADDTPLVNNEYIILKNGKKSALAVYKKSTDTVERIHKSSAYGIIPRNAEQSFALNALLDPMTPLVSLTGKAGYR